MGYICVLLMNVVSCDADTASKISLVVTAHDKAKQDSALLCLPFKTIFEYLFYLRGVSCLLGTGMAYLAAAVADFYVPYEDMVIAIIIVIIVCFSLLFVSFSFFYWELAE